MKKFFEKHGLFAVLCLSIFIFVLLSWLIPGGSFSGTEFAKSGVTPVGLTDLFTYNYLTFYYFSAVVIFLLVLGGFYGVLSTTKGYKALVDKTVKFVKGKELFFIIIVSLLFAIVASISNEIYHTLLFVPFVITVILKSKMDKITAFCTTFGSILVGVFGATFSSLALSSMVSTFSIAYTDSIMYKVGMFVFAFIALNVFNCLHTNSTVKASEESEDLFVTESVTGKVHVWPIIVVLVLLLGLQVLGFVNWTESFQVTTFTNFNTWLGKITAFDVPIISRIFGTLAEFGKWQLFHLAMLMVLAAMLIVLIYRTKLSDALDGALEGIKKIIKPLLIVMLVYTVCVLAVLFPILPTITDWILGLTSGVKVVLSGVASFVASVFSVEMRYVVANVGGLLTNTGVAGTTLALVTQAAYGLVQFVAPTSVILMLGLSYLGISYKKYFKYMWKFLLVLLAGVVILTTILMLI